MARYLCSSCHEVVESASMRVAFCGACGAPVTTEDLLPVQPITAGRGQPELAIPEPSS
jgi:hypothetical protein